MVVGVFGTVLALSVIGGVWWLAVAALQALFGG